MPDTYLLVLGDATPLAWVIAEQRMAFSAARMRTPSRLEVGDDMLLYATRSCFHNPRRDRGRLIGRARVASRVVLLPDPIIFGDREFAYGCDLELMGITPIREGVELARFVNALQLFSHARAWGTKLRRSLVPLSAADAELLQRKLAPVLEPVERHIDSYVEAARPARARRR